ncbi:uncharacterized protein LOC110040329 isoform X2 [Orbicella faveolata]|uniref:uncharacterized protein LOC110040329 isoform X2 n=1 Tax=Orbicella faveolata TaxID=48498 RepID=UPI0009E647F1|nr:uncharacterized protein LOC110040329 isoform X2 [Orbicella faveolata]
MNFLTLSSGCLIFLLVVMVQSSSLKDIKNDMEFEQMYRSFLEEEEVSDEPEECDVNYEKVGCFKDKTDARALSVRIFSDRKNIDWEAGKWEKFLKRLACRCAKESRTKGYDHFGLQYYGECWSDPEAADKFDRYGKSENCMGFAYKPCDDEDSNECVGGENKNYVYRVEEGGSASGFGSAP